MNELKVDIRYVISQFKNNKNTTETAKIISSVNGQHVITHCQAQNCFLKVLFWRQMNPDLDAYPTKVKILKENCWNAIRILKN